jgi:DNA-binding transcriptional LysR family regulator
VIELWDLKVFLTVAAERSFSRAAVALGRTQPAISQTIQRLEHELGEPLLDRTSKLATLTVAGTFLQRHGSSLMQHAEQTEAALRQQCDVRRGIVYVGADETAIGALLPMILKCHGECPDIVIDIRHVEAPQVVANVSASLIDFGVVSSNRPAKGLRHLAIAADYPVVLLSPSHRLAREALITRDQLCQETVIVSTDPSGALDRVSKSVGDPKHFPKVMYLPGLDAMKLAIQMQLGVALLPQSCGQYEIAEGRLVAVPIASVSAQ